MRACDDERARRERSASRMQGRVVPPHLLPDGSSPERGAAAFEMREKRLALVAGNGRNARRKPNARGRRPALGGPGPGQRSGWGPHTVRDRLSKAANAHLRSRGRPGMRVGRAKASMLTRGAGRIFRHRSEAGPRTWALTGSDDLRRQMAAFEAAETAPGRGDRSGPRRAPIRRLHHRTGHRDPPECAGPPSVLHLLGQSSRWLRQEPVCRV